jgi:hypothetical protein
MRLVHRFRIARLYRTPVPVLVIVPTHLSVAGERGVSAGSPGQGTVVAITPGVGTEEGACPLPAGGGTANPPPRPGLITSRSEPVGLSPIAPDKDQDRFPRRWTIDRRAANSALKRRSSPELGGILTSLHTERSRVWGLPLPAQAGPGHNRTERAMSRRLIEQGSLPVANPGRSPWKI